MFLVELLMEKFRIMFQFQNNSIKNFKRFKSTSKDFKMKSLYHMFVNILNKIIGGEER